MNRLKIASYILFVCGYSYAYAQTSVVPVYSCENPGVNAITSGLKSSNFLQAIIPSCLVTVYNSGSTTKATIYKDSNNTPQDNPFKANTNGSIPPIYASTGQPFDVVLSGGVPPNVYQNPVTLTGINAGGGGGGSANISGQVPQELSVAATPTSIASSTPFATFLQTATLSSNQTVNIPNVAKISGGGYVQFLSPNISGNGSFFHNIGDPLTSVDQDGNSTAIFDTMHINAGQNSEYHRQSTLYQQLAAGTYTGNGFTDDKDESLRMLVARRGISQAKSYVCSFYYTGDGACPQYVYGEFYGGAQFFNDEGINGVRYTLAQKGWLSGVLSMGGTGASNVSITAPVCNGGSGGSSCKIPNAGYTFSDGAILYDQTRGGTVTATVSGVSQISNALVATLTTSPLTTSTAWGNMGTCDNSTFDNFQNYFQVVCSVTLGTSPASPGPFVSGQHMWISGAYDEEVQVTGVTAPTAGVQSVTFQSRHDWINGVGGIMMQGGPGGQVIVQSAQVSLGTNGWPMAWEGIGAYAPNQLVFGNCHIGSCNGNSTAGLGVLPSGGITLYPGAETIGIHNNNLLSTNLATNKVPWTIGDTIVEAPVTEYQINGVVISQSQRTPADNGTSSNVLSIQDSGPSSAINEIQVTNTATNTVPFALLEGQGSFNYDMSFFSAPVSAVMHIGSSAQATYDLLLDDAAQAITIHRSPHNYVDFNGFIISTDEGYKGGSLNLSSTEAISPIATISATNPNGSTSATSTQAPAMAAARHVCSDVDLNFSIGNSILTCWSSTGTNTGYGRLETYNGTMPIQITDSATSTTASLMVNNGATVDNSTPVDSAPVGAFCASGIAFCVNSGSTFTVDTSGNAKAAGSDVCTVANGLCSSSSTGYVLTSPSSSQSIVQPTGTAIEIQSPTTAIATPTGNSVFEVNDSTNTWSVNGDLSLDAGQSGTGAINLQSHNPIVVSNGSSAAQKITGLANGTNASDAVNLSQISSLCQSNGTNCPVQAGHAVPGTTISSTITANSCAGGSFSVSFNTGITSSSTGDFNISQDPTTIGGWSTGALHVLVENTGTQFNVYICNSSATNVTAAPINFTFSETP